VTATQAEARELYAELARLYRVQMDLTGLTTYLVEHADPEHVKHHVNVFLWYARALPASGSVLDWGCYHGPDACLIRARLPQLDLHGCDFAGESGQFRVFRDYSRLQYTVLTDVAALPYAPNTFDAVVASGVLEHTAMDMESLKALFRVTKDGGTLIITYLPFRWSWCEWRKRRIGKEGSHRRLYGLRETETLLKHCGFYPLEVGYQTLVPNLVEGKLPSRLKRALAPIRHPVFSHDVLCCIAKKMTAM
jgi:SAM-dependent methyltransferase